MEAHRTETTVTGDGSVVVRGVPFPEGAEVEVIVLPRRVPGETAPLRGSVLRYDDPFGPAVPETDFDAAS